MRSLLVAAVFLLVACGAPVKPGVDAGSIDTSCGLDCDAQKAYGLLYGTCFEYANGPTGTNPPAIGALVQKGVDLEGGIKNISVEYYAGGQLKMRDSFSIKEGTLLLLRREFSGGSSVTFKNAGTDIVGVRWLNKSSGAGTNLTSTSNADVLPAGGTRKSESTDYRVSLAEASGSQATVPAQSNPFDGGLQMIFSETPDHGSDGLRVWVPQVGFINFSSSFELSGGNSLQYRLQRIRSIGTDGGEPCSLGAP